MQCKSCNESVPERFAHAISINVCPLCGKEILDTYVKNILNELKTVLDKAKEHFAEVEDWLLANYNLRQIKEGEVVVSKDDLPPSADAVLRPAGKSGKGSRVHRSADDEDDEDQDTALVQGSQPLNEFALRAGVNPKITSQKALEFIKGKTKQEDTTDAIKEAFLQGEEEVVDESPLDQEELSTVRNMFEDSGSEDENSEHIKRMQKLKRLQQG